MMTDEEYIEEANKVIATLTRYGVREEIAQRKSRVFAWSNASASWYPEWYPYSKGDTIRLDANQFVMPFISHKRSHNLCKKFDSLPLYRNSFEYVWQEKEPINPIPKVMTEIAPNQHYIRVGEVHISVDECDDCHMANGQHNLEIEH